MGTSVFGYHAAAVQRPGHGGRRLLIATASLVLAAIVGLAAIYAGTSPSGRASDPLPAAALLVSSTPAPTAAAVDDVVDQGAAAGTASGLTVGFKEAPDRSAADTTDGDAAMEPESLVESQAVAGLGDPATVEPADVASAAGVPELGPVAADADVPASATLTDEPDVVVRRGWVCDGAVQLVDPRGRDWSLGRVSFIEGPGYERVVLHLERIGPGSGAPSSVTAEAFVTSEVRSAVPGISQPSLGKTTVALHLTDGIKGNLGLRGYRPRGLDDLKEFSVFRAARGASRVLISASADRCFRLRVPAWSETAANARKAQILVDIRS